MPFTPFHLGPGCAMKALAGRHFSLTVFGFAQVAMDVEPLVRLLGGGPVLHGFSHTYLGATLIAVLTVLAGRPVCQRLLDSWRPPADERVLTWLRGPRDISRRAALSGAFLGTYSHVLLDSMIHGDMHPFAPFGKGNPLLGLASFGAMHLVCLGTGLLGVIGLAVAYLLDGGPPAGSPSP